MPQSLFLGAGIYAISRLIHRISTSKPFNFLPESDAIEPSLKKEIIISILSGVGINLLFVGFTASSAVVGASIAVTALTISELFNALIHFYDKKVFRDVEFYGGLEIDFLRKELPLHGKMTISAKDVLSIKDYQQKNHSDCTPYIYGFNSRPVITFLSEKESMIVKDRCEKMNIQPPLSLYDGKHCKTNGEFQACIPVTTHLFGWWIHVVAKDKSCLMVDSGVLVPKNMHDFAVVIEWCNNRYKEGDEQIGLVWQGEESKHSKTREELRVLIELLEVEFESENESIFRFTEFMGRFNRPMIDSFQNMRDLNWIRLHL